MKVSNQQLELWIVEGISQVEMARRANVTRGCISQRLSRLNLAASRSSLVKHGDEIADFRINSMEQLGKMNASANELLDCCMRFHRGEEGAITLLEGQLRKFRVGRKGTEKETEEVKITDPRLLALKCMGEVREQLRLQNDVLKSIWDMRAAYEVEQEILAIVERRAPDVYREIHDYLQKKYALRSIVGRD